VRFTTTSESSFWLSFFTCRWKPGPQPRRSARVADEVLAARSRRIQVPMRRARRGEKLCSFAACTWPSANEPGPAGVARERAAGQALGDLAFASGDPGVQVIAAAAAKRLRQDVDRCVAAEDRATLGAERRDRCLQRLPRRLAVVLADLPTIIGMPNFSTKIIQSRTDMRLNTHHHATVRSRPACT
jgi:hypothetical protein